MIPDRVDDKGMIPSRDGALYQGAVGDLSVFRVLRSLFGQSGSVLPYLWPFALAPLLQPAQNLGDSLNLVGGNVVVELGIPIEGTEQRDALQHRDPLLFGNLAYLQRLGIGEI